MKRLNPLDASWLYVESRDTPMQVAGLMIFSPPKDAGDDFIANLVKSGREARAVAAPWNLRLRQGPLKTMLPMWEEVADVDMEYHVRHSALPRPGGERELGVLVSRLHSRPLDFHRPLWECHIIEGLEGGRFALYSKMHHALMDGIASMRLMQSSMATSPEQELPPPWAFDRPRGASESAESVPDASGMPAKLMSGLRKQANSVSDLTKAMGEVVRAARDPDDPLVAPFQAPKSVLNHRVTGQRRFATQQYDLARVKALSKAASCTLNDIVLWLCSTALRRFLLEAGELPNKPLVGGLPVSIRPNDGSDTGNAISFILCSLGSHLDDPMDRLDAIRESTARAKEHLQALPKAAIMNYTIATMAPYILTLLTGLAGRTRPIFNVTISNVPGPTSPLYLSGAKLEAMYPVSLITHGQALNITCISYNGTLNFGFITCRDTLPHMQRLAVYTGEALDELEGLLLPKAKGRKKA